MKGFYWYSMVAGLITTISFLQKKFYILNRPIWGLINNLLLLFHFIFLSLFIYGVLANKKFFRIMNVLFFTFIIIILFCLFTNNLSGQNSTAFAFTNFGLVIFCCFYYFQLFEDMPTVNLLDEPSFWIINGIFFCMSATIPVLALRYYSLNKMSVYIYSIIEILIPFLYGIMHLFFIKAYLCSKDYHKK